MGRNVPNYPLPQVEYNRQNFLEEIVEYLSRLLKRVIYRRSSSCGDQAACRLTMTPSYRLISPSFIVTSRRRSTCPREKTGTVLRAKTSPRRGTSVSLTPSTADMLSISEAYRWSLMFSLHVLHEPREKLQILHSNGLSLGSQALQRLCLSRADDTPGWSLCL
jgi:hypothetical protein